MKLTSIIETEISKIQDGKAPQLSQYADKLNASRKKLKRVDTLVMQTKERVANIARMHNQLLESERKFMEREAAAATTPNDAAEKPVAEGSAPAAENPAPAAAEAVEKAAEPAEEAKADGA